MQEYMVTWQIQVWAESPREAAQQAMEMQQDPDAICHYYTIHTDSDDPSVTVDIDLDMAPTVRNAKFKVTREMSVTDDRDYSLLEAKTRLHLATTPGRFDELEQRWDDWIKNHNAEGPFVWQGAGGTSWVVIKEDTDEL